MEGAKKMMDGNKMIMDTVAKKGMKDAELTSAEKMMTDGYNMVTKGESMMTGSTMAEGKEMVTHGAKMMLEAQKATTAAVEKKGPELVKECTIGLDSCKCGRKKDKRRCVDVVFWHPRNLAVTQSPLCTRTFSFKEFKAPLGKSSQS